jgi:hypothetical protein
VAVRTQDESQAGPVTLEELARRGFVAYTVGNRIVNVNCVDTAGHAMSFVLPEQTHAESKAEDSEWEKRILDLLSKRSKPIEKLRLNELLNGASTNTGGRYGTAIRALTESKRITVANGYVTDDPKKFETLE